MCKCHAATLAKKGVYYCWAPSILSNHLRKQIYPFANINTRICSNFNTIFSEWLMNVYLRGRTMGRSVRVGASVDSVTTDKARDG